MKPGIKKQAARRLKIAAGQVRGIEEMIMRDAYCVDVITQIEAAREALSGAGDMVMKNHLETHVLHQMRSGGQKKATAEILKLYKLAQRNK